jgi:hypothetical protein
MKPEEKAFAKKRLGKHITAAMNPNATMDKVLDAIIL